MSPDQTELKEFKAAVSKSLTKWQKCRRINRNWDGSLTIATIVLTLMTTVFSIEDIELGDQARKRWIGVFGGAVVAIQSIGNAFPVKQRAGGYSLLQGQGYALKNELDYLTDNKISESLPAMKKEYYKLLSEESKLEG